MGGINVQLGGGISTCCGSLCLHPQEILYRSRRCFSVKNPMDPSFGPLTWGRGSGICWGVASKSTVGDVDDVVCLGCGQTIVEPRAVKSAREDVEKFRRSARRELVVFRSHLVGALKSVDRFIEELNSYS